MRALAEAEAAEAMDTAAEAEQIDPSPSVEGGSAEPEQINGDHAPTISGWSADETAKDAEALAAAEARLAAANGDLERATAEREKAEKIASTEGLPPEVTEQLMLRVTDAVSAVEAAEARKANAESEVAAVKARTAASATIAAFWKVAASVLQATGHRIQTPGCGDVLPSERFDLSDYASETAVSEKIAALEQSKIKAVQAAEARIAAIKAVARGARTYLATVPEGATVDVANLPRITFQRESEGSVLVTFSAIRVSQAAPNRNTTAGGTAEALILETSKIVPAYRGKFANVSKVQIGGTNTNDPSVRYFANGKAFLTACNPDWTKGFGAHLPSWRSVAFRVKEGYLLS